MAGIRTQNQLFGFGYKTQTAIATANPVGELLRLNKLNPDIAYPMLTKEDDAAEMGKGDEFALQEYAVAWDTKVQFRKYLTSQIAMWAYSMGLGNVTAQNANSSTIIPLDATQTIELPYFSVLQQMNPISSTPGVDQLLPGCALEDLQIDINNGPGRQSSQITFNVQGSGRFIEPSGYTMPGASAEVQLLAQNAAVTINGVDYVNGAARGNLQSIRLGLKNNIDPNTGFFIGSGSQTAGVPTSGAIRGRHEFTNRVYSLSFTTRLVSNSAEFRAMSNLTTGSAVVTLSGGANDLMTVNHPKVSFKAVEMSNANNIAVLNITCTVFKDPALGPIVVTAKNSTVAGIGAVG